MILTLMVISNSPKLHYFNGSPFFLQKQIFSCKNSHLDLSQTTQRVNYEHIRSGEDPFNVHGFRRIFYSNLYIKHILELFYTVFYLSQLKLVLFSFDFD